MLTAERPQNPGGLITLLVQRRWPESFTADAVGESIHRRAKLVSPSPHFIEAFLALGLGRVPGRQLGRHLLHLGDLIKEEVGRLSLNAVRK